MKFKIFTFEEMMYKWISYSTVFIVTVVIIAFYLFFNSNSTEGKNSLASDEITFIVGLLYALLLFIISVYMTSVSNKTQNMFYRRKEQYLYLKRLSELYTLKYSKESELISFISLNQGFTRLPGRNNKQYIKQDGFQFTKKYLHLENDFMEYLSDLKNEWNTSINNYIGSRNLETKSKSVHIFDLEEFLNDVDTWINDKLDLTIEQTINFNYLIDRNHNNFKKKYKRLQKTMKKIQSLINKTNKKSKSNILRLEKVYGERLIESLNAEQNLLANLSVLESRIKELKDIVLTTDDIEEIAEVHFGKLNNYLYDIDTKLEEVSSNIDTILDNVEF